MIKKVVFAVVIAIGFGQCKTKAPVSTNNKDIENMPLRAPISRGTIRVMAEVIKINPISKNEGDAPCDNYPCEATIKIEKVVDTGAFFEGEVVQGQPLDAYFVKTLASTEDIYPELKQHLPGLKVEDKFQADIVYNPKATAVSKYHVVAYKKL